MDEAATGRYQAPMAAFVQPFALHNPGRRAVGWWLVALALLIAAMVVVGGLTRLTGSGLSITEWHPVTGVVPPLSDQAWAAEFAKYQHIPQYKFEHRGMTVGEFKTIYWWEWTHRLLGRLIGFAFLLPFLYFVAARAIPREGIPRMVVLFALGGLQGFVGWWMVESGLETRVSVSQYRLAIHLGVALILFAAILWTALEYLTGSARLQTRSAARRISSSSLRYDECASGDARSQWAFVFTALVYIQMLLGALVAGLHAGLVYNTWPSMNGHLFPEGAFFSQPWWINFFENAGLAQFDHRVGAYLIAVGAVWLWIVSRNNSSRVRTSANAVVAVTFLQATLGILTLVDQVPVPLAALHQVTAVALLSAAIWHAFELSSAPQTAEST
jgi:cytochrome c oxidase assembly protein subunit 15